MTFWVFLVPNKAVKVADDVGIGLHLMFCCMPWSPSCLHTSLPTPCFYVVFGIAISTSLYILRIIHNLSGIGAVNSDLTTKFFCVYYVLMCTVSNHGYVVPKIR